MNEDVQEAMKILGQLILKELRDLRAVQRNLELLKPRLDQSIDSLQNLWARIDTLAGKGVGTGTLPVRQAVVPSERT